MVKNKGPNTPEEKARLGLTKPSDYQYLSQDNLNKALSNKCYAKGQGSCLRLVSKTFRILTEIV